MYHPRGLSTGRVFVNTVLSVFAARSTARIVDSGVPVARAICAGVCRYGMRSTAKCLRVCVRSHASVFATVKLRCSLAVHCTVT